MTKLIAFDLDGTLVDSRLDLAESANQLLGELGGAALPVDRVVGMVGDGARVLIERVLAAAGIVTDLDAALDRFLDIYDGRLLVHTRLYPGLEVMLAAVAPRVPLAVLTNKPQHHTERLLAGIGVRERFTWVVGGDAGFPRKPDPASLVALMARARAQAAETVFVGDSMVDVETGRRAGTTVCAVGYGFARFREGLSLWPGEHLAPEPADLEPLLQRILDLGAPGIRQSEPKRS